MRLVLDGLDIISYFLHNLLQVSTRRCFIGNIISKNIRNTNNNSIIIIKNTKKSFRNSRNSMKNN